MFAYALDNGKAAALAVFVASLMSDPREHNAMLTWAQFVTGPRRPGLDHRCAFQADKDIRQGGVLMPRDLFSARQRQYLHAQTIGLHNKVAAGYAIGQVLCCSHCSIH